MKEKIFCIDIANIVGTKSQYLYLSGWAYPKGSDNTFKSYKIEMYQNGKLKQTFDPNIQRSDIAILFRDEPDKINTKVGFDLRVGFNTKDKIVFYIVYDDNNTKKKVKLFTPRNQKLKAIVHVIRVWKVFARWLLAIWRTTRFILNWGSFKYYLNKLKIDLTAHFSKNPICLDFNDVVQYNIWLEQFEKDSEIIELEYNPLISIIIPVYNVPSFYLKLCVQSIKNQIYKNWELIIVDDLSTDEELKKTLKEYENDDPKIKVVYRKENGHISKACNTGIEKANGEYIIVVDNDDEITKDALYEIAKAVNDNPELDLIYSDEDSLDLENHRFRPHFKPDWSPDTFLSHNYICHIAALRKSIVDEIGGFKSEYVGAQDYEILLRFTEKTNKIHHIPKVLYHWRMIPGSTSMDVTSKNYAFAAGKQALIDTLERRNIKGEVSNYYTSYTIKYDHNNESVSIIIPIKDKINLLDNLLKSIYNKATYQNYEIIIVDNGSQETKTIDKLNQYQKQYSNFSVLRLDCPFNYSYLNNEAAKMAKNDFLLFLNNDTELITPDLIEQLVGHARQKHIGAVGCKLLYKNNTIQHGGVVVQPNMHGLALPAYIHHKRDYGGHFSRLIVPYNYSAVTGACLMIEKTKFNQINGFDENLPVNYNDIDLCLNLINNNYYNVLLPKVEMYHYESQSRGKDVLTGSKYKAFKNDCEYLQNKWPNLIKQDKFYNPNFSNNYLFMLPGKNN